MSIGSRFIGVARRLGFYPQKRPALGQFEVANFMTWPAVFGLIVFVFVVVIVLCVLVPVTCVGVVVAASES